MMGPVTLDSLIAERVFNLPPEHSETPSWSTDIAKAWDVVEEMERKGFWLKLLTDWYHSPTRRTTSVWFTPYDKHPNNEDVTHARTAPRAICLAALAALAG